MRRRADPVGPPFRQEADRMPLLPADFLGGMLGNRVVISGFHRATIADVEFFLTGLGLAL